MSSGERNFWPLSASENCLDDIRSKQSYSEHPPHIGGPCPETLGVCS